MPPPIPLAAPKLTSVPRLRPQCLLQANPKSASIQHDTRSFQTSATRNAKIGDVQLPRGAMRLLPKQQNMAQRMKNLSRSELPTDFGLIPMTFIRPPARELPKLLSSGWKRRLRIEWYWLKTRFQNLLSVYSTLQFMAKKDPATNRKKKSPLRMAERAEIARLLHAKFYLSLAQADMNTINDIACNGLAQTAKSQIDQREGSDMGQRSFAIDKYNGLNYPRWVWWPLQPLMPFNASKVVADRASPLPIGQESWIRQTVVRIKSRQSISKLDGNGKRTADQTEYVVIQMTKTSGVEAKWRIWGTIQPSTEKDIAKLLEDASATEGQSISDRLAQLRSSVL